MKKTVCVSFDLFGTLLDLPGVLGPLLGSKVLVFLRELEHCAEHEKNLSYTQLVEHACRAAAPHLPEKFSNKIGRAVGLARPYAGASAIHGLSTRAWIGLVGNGDRSHFEDASRALQIPFDFTISSEQAGGFFESQEIVDRQVGAFCQKTGLTPDRWIHVSAQASMVERFKKAGVQALKLDGPIKDLKALVEQLPLEPSHHYEVEVGCQDADTAKVFLNWMKNSHAQDLLNIDGCLECKVVGLSDFKFRCEYVFSSKDAFEFYIENHAPKLRKEGLDLFVNRKVEFQRQDAQIHWLQRERYLKDFYR